MSICGLILAWVIFYWPILSGQGFLWEDFPEQWYPFASYTASELRMGRLPLWNPYLFGGIPYLAMIDVAVLYPLNWIMVLFVEDNILGYLVVEFQVIAHVLLIGCTTYAFARGTGISRYGSLIAGLIYMLCGVTVHNVIHPVFVFGLSWFPLVFLLFKTAVSKQSLRFAVFSGGLLGVLIVAGHAQVFVYVSYLLAFYLLFSLVQLIRESASQASLLKMIAIGIVTIVTSLAIGAGVLLPMMELAPHALRPAVTYEVATTYARYPAELITFFIPDFFGQTQPLKWNYWGPGSSEYGHFWETHSYLGLFPLLLAGIPPFLKRTRFVVFLTVLGLVSLILAFGDATPFYRIAYNVVPGFDRFRGAARLSIFCSFSVAILSGIGIDTLLNMDRELWIKFKRYILTFLGLMVSGFIVYLAFLPSVVDLLAETPDKVDAVRTAFIDQIDRFGLLCAIAVIALLCWNTVRIPRSIKLCITLTVIFMDLYLAGAGFAVSPKGPGDYYPKSALIEFLEERQDQEGGRARTRQERIMLMTRNAGVLYRIHTLEGYASPLRLAETLPPRFSDELMGVRYGIQVGDEGKSASLVANVDAMPSAYVVRKYVLARDRDAVALAMDVSSFDHRTSVVLDRLPDMEVSDVPVTEAEHPVISEYLPNAITLDISLDSPGILVFGEVYYPAWKAYVNGEKVDILRANDTMRAVPLGRGNHHVVMRYESSAVTWGLFISSAAVLLVLSLAVFSRGRDQQ